MTHHYYIDPLNGNDKNSGLEKDVALQTSNEADRRYQAEKGENDELLLTIITGERVTV